VAESTVPPPPLFILAAPFSGASWLAAVLGRHPQVCALPQVFPFMAETVGEIGRASCRERVS
jgi:hypothetical protein